MSGLRQSPDGAIACPRNQDWPCWQAEEGHAGHEGQVPQAVALDLMRALHSSIPL